MDGGGVFLGQQIITQGQLSTNTYEDLSIDFSRATSGPIYVRVGYLGTATTNLYIDKVVLKKLP